MVKCVLCDTTDEDEDIRPVTVTYDGTTCGVMIDVNGDMVELVVCNLCRDQVPEMMNHFNVADQVIKLRHEV